MLIGMDHVTESSKSLFQDAMLLGKPRISLMVLLTVVIGMYASASVSISAFLLINTLIGVALVASASSILNQAWERETDSLMRRTADRPVAAGRITPRVGYFMGWLFCVVGTVYLAAMVNPLTAGVALLTLVLYVGLYTPLKRYTAWNTLIGAVPGAMPCLIGAAAVGNVGLAAWLLFGILFVWQFPHFFAISWLHRQDYAQAGLVMLSTIDKREGKTTGIWAIGTAILLYAVCLLPALLMPVSWYYLSGVVVFSGYYLFESIRFWQLPSRATARKVLFASLYHLPVVFVLFLIK